MFEAITFDLMLENIRENSINSDTIGILLARPKSDAGESIINNLPYYHHRSGYNINFYLPGYGAFWHEMYPDEIDVVKIEGNQWSFSNQKFVEFISCIEGKSQWKYSGESELLLVEFRNYFFSFSNVLRFHLDAMLRDGVVPSINAFFEGLFREISRGRSLSQISGAAGVKTLGQVTVESVMEVLPSFFGGFIKKGKHYIVHDYSINSL